MVICFYIVSAIIPFDLPIFSFGSYIIALFFPFITRRYRVAITGVYQLVNLSAMWVWVDQARPFLENMVYKPVQTVEVSTGVSGEAVNYVFQGVAAYNWMYLAALAGGMILFLVTLYALWFLAFFAIFTQPYSVYFLYERLGLIRRLNGAASFASPEWFRS